MKIINRKKKFVKNLSFDQKETAFLVRDLCASRDNALMHDDLETYEFYREMIEKVIAAI